MNSFDDLLQLARICRRQADAAASESVADELRRMADEYLRRAADLNGGIIPELGSDPA
jgi:hypothetical protein